MLPNRSSAQRIIIGPGRKRATKEQTYLYQTGSSNLNCSGSTNQIVMRFSKNTIEVSRKVLLAAHDIPRRGSGDLLRNRFWSLEKMIVDGV